MCSCVSESKAEGHQYLGNRAPVQKQGYRTNQNASESELELVQRTGHPSYCISILVQIYIKVSNYKPVSKKKCNILEQVVFLLYGLSALI